MKILMRNKDGVAVHFTNEDLQSAGISTSEYYQRDKDRHPEASDDAALKKKLEIVLREHGKAVADLLHKKEIGMAVKTALESVQAFLGAIDRLEAPVVQGEPAVPEGK